MSAQTDDVHATLSTLIARHAAHCPALVRGRAAGKRNGETVYELRCPACGRIIAHLVLDPREVQA